MRPIDDAISFSPWHGLENHRPPGSVMRARKAAYAASGKFRAAHNGQLIAEPTGAPVVVGLRGPRHMQSNGQSTAREEFRRGATRPLRYFPECQPLIFAGSVRSLRVRGRQVPVGGEVAGLGTTQFGLRRRHDPCKVCVATWLDFEAHHKGRGRWTGCRRWRTSGGRIGADAADKTLGHRGGDQSNGRRSRLQLSEAGGMNCR